MKNYQFIAPKKNRTLYIIINILIFATIIFTRLMYEELFIVAIPISVFFLFNGLWSINRKWYSFIHRDDKSYSKRYAWFIFMIPGISLSTLITIYIIL